MIARIKNKLFYKIEEDRDEEQKKVESYTFKLHLFSQILNGSAFGIMVLQDVILKKSLLSTDFAVTILIFLLNSSLLSSIYGVEIVNRARDRSKAIIRLALFSKSFLFIIPFFESTSWFVFCLAAMAYSDALLKPFWNIVLKHNYSDKRRSIYYSYTTAAHILFILITATLMGFVLNIDFRYYKILFPLAGVFDIIAYINLSKLIHIKEDAQIVHEEKFTGKINTRLIKDIIVLPIRSMLRIFKVNKEFLRFESYFMMYGVAFMMLSIAMPIYLVEVLKLGYIEISTARGLIFQGASILLSPVLGRLFGHGNPMKFTGIVFIILSVFPFMLLTIEIAGLAQIYSADILIYIAFFIFGLSMSGINLSWTLSSIYYAPHSEVPNYQAVHITLTGIRGAIAPFLGYAIMKLFSIPAVFVLSGLLLILGGSLMLRERKKIKRNNGLDRITLDKEKFAVTTEKISDVTNIKSDA